MEALFNSGWGAPSFGSSLLGLLLTLLFDPNNSTFAKHPLCSSDTSFPDNFAEMSEKEQKAFMEEHLDEYWKKYLDKISNPKEEDAKKLEASLSEVNAKIKALNDERQEIIDEWILQ